MTSALPRLRHSGAAVAALFFVNGMTFSNWLPRVPVRSVDSTGAGDAFAAALAVMLAEDESLVEAATFANAAAAQKTAVVGAQAGLPKRETVLAMLATLGTPGAARK